MTTQIAIECDYTVTSYDVIDLPEDKTWDDVTDVFVKWGTLFLTFSDKSQLEKELRVLSWDTLDMKYPATERVYATDTNGDADYDNQLK